MAPPAETAADLARGWPGTVTFETKGDARAWLAIHQGSTRLSPTFHDLPVKNISPELVRRWYADLGEHDTDLSGACLRPAAVDPRHRRARRAATGQPMPRPRRRHVQAGQASAAGDS